MSLVSLFTRGTSARAIRTVGTMAALAAAAFLAPSAATAQSPVSPGTLSLSLGLDSSPEAGVWFTATNHTRIGLIGTLERRTRDVEGSGDTFDSQSWLRYSGGPAVKGYLAGNNQRVAPYWYIAGVAGIDDPPTDARTTSFGADLGFGADWFPVPQISLGGTTGLSMVRDRTKNGDVTITESSIRTLTFGLRMHLYF